MMVRMPFAQTRARVRVCVCAHVHIKCFPGLRSLSMWEGLLCSVSGLPEKAGDKLILWDLASRLRLCALVSNTRTHLHSYSAANTHAHSLSLYFTEIQARMADTRNRARARTRARTRARAHAHILHLRCQACAHAFVTATHHVTLSLLLGTLSLLLGTLSLLLYAFVTATHAHGRHLRALSGGRRK